eukprot:384197_1
MWLLLFSLSAIIIHAQSNSRTLLQYDGSFNSWIVSDLLLPRQCLSGAAVGYFNNSIYIIGGACNNQQSLIAYDPSSNTFTDYGTTTLSPNSMITLVSQSYTQINDIIYFIQNHDADRLAIFDLLTKQSTFNYSDLVIPISSFDSPQCLTSIKQQNDGIDYLFIIPRYNTYNTINILNTSSNTWLNLSDIQPMQITRQYPSCAIVNNKLYMIGGFGTDTIETINIPMNDIYNISNQHWNMLSDTLTLSNRSNKSDHTDPVTNQLIYSRTIIVGTDILVIGGYNGARIKFRQLSEKGINVIDTTSDRVYVDGYLNYGVWFGTAILFENIIYIFGGSNQELGGTVNTWQYKNLLPTNEPTNAPTSDPTKMTNNPTNNPSGIPTNTPTMYPSSTPSNNPTMKPTSTPLVVTDKTNTDSNLFIIIIILIIIIVVILIVLIIVIVILKNKVLNKETKINTNNEQMNIQTNVINITSDHEEQNELNNSTLSKEHDGIVTTNDCDLNLPN